MNANNEDKINELKQRIDKLEDKQQNDYKEIMENNKQLAIIINELRTITKTMENLASNWKEAIANNNETQRMAKEEIERRLSAAETNISNLSTKLDNRTILKDSKRWNDVIWVIISGVVGSIVTIFVSKFK